MSGGVIRLKKAKRWRDFSNETAKMGIDTAKYGYEQYQDAMNPVNKATSSVKKLLGGKKMNDVWKKLTNELILQ